MALPGIVIEAPSVPPLPFGLTSVADVAAATGHLVSGYTYQTLCGVGTNLADDPCSRTGTSEVQTATITGSPTGGTYTLTFQGQTTVPIAHNASNATVQAAIDALGLVEPGDITVAGTATSRTYTFGGNYAGMDAPQITPTNVAFTGGTSPAIAIVTTTQGVTTAKTDTATLTTVTGVAFTVYTRFTCRPVGLSEAERDRIGMQALSNGESWALERYLLTNVFNSATDLTPVGGAVRPEIGLAMLEQKAAEDYAGVPTIHVNRGTGSLLGSAGSIERRGNRLESIQGALISSGGGYIAADTYAADGDSVMYLTGMVTVRRGVAHSHMGQAKSGSAYLNDFTALAERTYVVASECMNYKISVINDPA